MVRGHKDEGGIRASRQVVTHASPVMQARRASFEVALAWISPQIVTRRVSEEAYRVASFLANASGYEKCANSKLTLRAYYSNRQAVPLPKVVHPFVASNRHNARQELKQAWHFWWRHRPATSAKGSRSENS